MYKQQQQQNPCFSVRVEPEGRPLGSTIFVSQEDMAVPGRHGGSADPSSGDLATGRHIP